MIADFKSPFADKVRDILGGDIETIKKNLIYRVKTGKPLLIRIPLIRFFNCGEENAKAFGEFFAELETLSCNNLFFEILTYHEFGKEKYTKLGMEYSVTDGYISEDDVKILLTELKNRNLKTINT